MTHVLPLSLKEIVTYSLMDMGELKTILANIDVEIAKENQLESNIKSFGKINRLTNEANAIAKIIIFREELTK